MSNQIPKHARAVVVGGGIIGTSIAYHLAKLGWDDVVLLERDRLTSGTTWHAAGLIAAAGMSSETTAFIAKYTNELYREIESESGLATGFKECGHLQLACTPARQEMMRREANFMRMFGIERYEVSPKEVAERFPPINIDGVVSALWTPNDGRVNPVDVTMSLAGAARKRGVKIFENCSVNDFVLKNGRIVGVDTSFGRIESDTVVLAAGMWSRQLAAKIGVSVPLQAAEHYYLLTEPLDVVNSDMPVVEDPDSYAYVREEGGGLLFGLFEPDAAVWSPREVPGDASFLDLPADWERMTPHLEHAFRRFPIMNEAGIRTFFCGPESFTPDGSPIVGQSPEVQGLYIAAGLNSLGVLSGGGVGCLLAEEIVHGNASQDMTGLSPNSRPVHESTHQFLMDRTPATLSAVFTDYALPNWKHKTARNARRLALHERYAEQGAYFVSLSGWEVPNWFSPDGPPPKVNYEFGRQDWFYLAEKEHNATRNSVCLFDKTFMGKFYVEGPDAETVLNRISGNSVSVPIGRNIYTQWLDEDGRILSDLTITRVSEQKFLLVTTDILQRFTAPWVKRNTKPGEFCVVTDVTSAYVILSLQGPKSRDLLSKITGADLSTESVPFRHSLEVEIGYSRFLMVRVTYMGELGYELYVPTEQAVNVYDALVSGFEAEGVEFVNGGLVALESLRLEKAYRDFGADIDNTDTALEAGLGFVVDFDKPEFIGKEALLAQREKRPYEKRLLAIKLEDPEPLLVGGEPILLDGEPIGYVRAGAYGHTIGASVGIAAVEREGGVSADFIKSGSFEVQMSDRRVAATLSIRPFYDPKSERVRA